VSYIFKRNTWTTRQTTLCWSLTIMPDGSADKGHAGNPENERCDQLSMAALHQPNLPADEGYENKPETEGERPKLQEGEPCRKCSTPVIKRKGRWKPSRDYYYEYHLFCPKCQTTYHVEEAKRFVEQPPLLF
jgi:formamidopyrimidine-DNA glycosylase